LPMSCCSYPSGLGSGSLHMSLVVAVGLAYREKLRPASHAQPIEIFLFGSISLATSNLP